MINIDKKNTGPQCVKIQFYFLQMQMLSNFHLIFICQIGLFNETYTERIKIYKVTHHETFVIKLSVTTPGTNR
jgi:hypothetical protein